MGVPPAVEKPPYGLIHVTQTRLGTLILTRPGYGIKVMPWMPWLHHWTPEKGWSIIPTSFLEPWNHD